MGQQRDSAQPVSAGSHDLFDRILYLTERVVRVEEGLKAVIEQIRSLNHQMDKRFADLIEYSNKRFEEQTRNSERQFKTLLWFIGVAWAAVSGMIILFRFFVE